MSLRSRCQKQGKLVIAFPFIVKLSVCNGAELSAHVLSRTEIGAVDVTWLGDGSSRTSTLHSLFAGLSRHGLHLKYSASRPTTRSTGEYYLSYFPHFMIHDSCLLEFGAILSPVFATKSSQPHHSGLNTI